MVRKRQEGEEARRPGEGKVCGGMGGGKELTAWKEEWRAGKMRGKQQMGAGKGVGEGGKHYRQEAGAVGGEREECQRGGSC